MSHRRRCRKAGRAARRPPWPRRAGAASGNQAPPESIEELATGGDLLHVADPIRNGSGTGVVLASQYPSGQYADKLRGMVQVLRGMQLAGAPPAVAGRARRRDNVDGDLVGSTWMGLYRASASRVRCCCCRKQPRKSAPGITTDRIEHEGTDEFGAMVDAFNAMAQKRRRAAAGSSGRASISNASTKKARAAAAISRRSSNALPLAWSRSIARLHRHHQPLGAAAARIRRRRRRRFRG